MINTNGIGRFLLSRGVNRHHPYLGRCCRRFTPRLPHRRHIRAICPAYPSPHPPNRPTLSEERAV
jgi:hypothetical protein